jgi:hypothetical protein
LIEIKDILVTIETSRLTFGTLIRSFEQPFLVSTHKT